MSIKLHCFGESGNAYKAALALELIDSLDRQGPDVPDVEWADSWGTEIADRLRTFERTRAADDHEVVIARAKARLAARRS